MQNQHIDSPFQWLAARIEGEATTEIQRRYMLSTDASIFRKMPAAVVYPRCASDVRETIRFAGGRGLSVHARGAGSGLCGSALGDGVVIDFTRYMNRLIEIDAKEGWFECEPGYRLGELEEEIAGAGLFFPPDPSSGEYATFGGMCATNASGAHSVKYGNTADYLLDAEMVFANGRSRRLNEIAGTPLDQLPENLQQLAALYTDNAGAIASAYPPVRCNVAGYNLRSLVRDGRLTLHGLFAGAEGTLGVAVRLRFRLLPRPAADSLVVAFCKDIVRAARAVQQITPLGPSGIEVMDKSLLRLAREADETLRGRIPEDVDNVLLIEFDGPSMKGSREPAARVRDGLLADGLAAEAHLAVSAEEKKRFWAVRKAAVPILYKLKGRKKILALVEDAAVPIDRLVDFFKGLYAIFNRRAVRFVLYGHIAKGLLHTRPLLDLKDPDDVRLLRPLADDVFELVRGLDGTVSGEHGDGRLRTAYIRRAFPGVYHLFLETKKLLDPGGMFNPDIKVGDDPEQMRRDLRFGGDYHVGGAFETRLNWPEGFAAEVEKCHGCGKCTTTTTGARMCPVYKITRDESAAPKAKANALRALISGAIPDDARCAEARRRVMSLCFNCGSCAVECPSNVDIPGLVIEAKAREARRRGASVTDLAAGSLGVAARVFHRLAPVVNPISRAPVVKKISQRLIGLSAERPPLLFARRSLYAHIPRETPGRGRGRVLLFPGCFAGYARPEIGAAAARTLHRLGFTVHVPPWDCCGLPMLSKGLTGGARRLARRNLRRRRRLIHQADAITVTCSSCGFALKKEWSGLVDDALAREVRDKTVHISQLILDHRERFAAGHPAMTLAYHQPCHLRLQKEKHSSTRLMRALPGVTLHDPPTPCCGMAGSWGLVAENQRLCRTIGGPMIRRLRESDADWAVTDCPTCEMQISHLGDLPVRHPAEVIWAWMRRSAGR
ncbi:MAG: FAD-binding protein [Desulfobacterales bacterium]|nr:FAD-binding protein [Desulfobacterales bacterium]